MAVARRVGDPFAEVNARINIFTQRSTAGVAPDPDEVLAIIDAAVEAGEYEEGYRAIVNLIWSTTGYLHVERIEEVVAEARARLADVPAPAVDRALPRHLGRDGLAGADRTVGRGRRPARPARGSRAGHDDAAGVPRCGGRARGTPRTGGRRVPGQAAPARASERRAAADRADGGRGRTLARSDRRSQGAPLPDGRCPSQRSTRAGRARSTAFRSCARWPPPTRSTYSGGRSSRCAGRARSPPRRRPRYWQATGCSRSTAGRAADAVGLLDSGGRARAEPRAHLRRGVPRARPGARSRSGRRRGCRERGAGARQRGPSAARRRQRLL